MADAKVKISALPSGTPQETDYIPYVDGVANSTKKALKSELKGVKGDKGDTGETGATGPQGPAGVGAEVVTTIATPGLDTTVPSEKAVRTNLDTKIDKTTLHTANSILIATTSDTPIELPITTNQVVGRINGSIVNVPIDSDLSSTSAGDDTVPSAKATKAMGDLKLAKTDQVTALAATKAGDKDKYLHSNASTGALEWSTVSANSLKFRMSVDLLSRATSGQITKTTSGTGALVTNENSNLKVFSGTSSTNFVQGTYNFSDNTPSNCKFFLGDSIISTGVYVYSASGSAATFFTGVTYTNMGTTTSGIVMTSKHIGFKFFNGNVYATNANGTTQTESAISTFMVGDFFELIINIKASSIDFYVRKNGGALSAATNHTTNIPTDNVENFCVCAFNNSGSSIGVSHSNYSYER